MKRSVLTFISLFLWPCLIRSQGTVVHIDQDSSYQTIRGFGGFGAKKVWWDSPPYYDAGYLDQIIDSLGCTFIRTQIYWDAETINDNTDPGLINWSKFNFGTDTDNGKQFAFIHDAGLRGANLLATVWTPPVWMKGLSEFQGTFLGNPVRRRPGNSDLNTNCAWCGGAAGCQQVGGWLKPEYYDEFAEYLVAYVKKVKEQTGVDVWGINIQNEPFFANPFESCVAIPSEYAAILKTVGKRFAAEGLSTRLFGPEHMGEISWGINNEYIREILGNVEVNPYLSFYAVHSYVDGVAPDYGSADGWTALYEKIVKGYDRELWMTETSDFDKQGYDLGFSMAKSLYLALKFGHISGWVYWAMADYVVKNNKLTPLGRAFQQYYRFLLPGTVMVKAAADDPDLLIVAGKIRDNLSIIIINEGQTDKTISLEGPDLPSEFKVFRTSANENFRQLPSTPSTGISLKAQSITSICSGDLPTAIHPVHAEDRNVEIMPNPAKGFIRVRNAGEGRISVWNTSGSCIQSHRLQGSDELIGIGDLPAGIYIVKINTLHTSSSQKLLIQ